MINTGLVPISYKNNLALTTQQAKNLQSAKISK